ncbi:acyltransferase [Flaviramulus basaltis]|nr:DapH/DapD/GlmU-related protein [Flaviramulus basaltis]
MLKRLLKSFGNNSIIKHDLCIESPRLVSIGNNSSIMAHCTIFAGAGVEIGDNVQISANCVISGATHPLDPERRKEQINKNVVIANNVWIGMSVSILPGVTIGENSIIGAGSVVTKSVPQNQIWVGNPAKLLKELN